MASHYGDNVNMAKKKTPPNPEVGRRLKELMDNHPTLNTQMALSKKADVGQTTIGRILRSETEAAADAINKIAVALGTTSDYLLNGNNSNLKGDFRKLEIVDHEEGHADYIFFKRYDVRASAGFGAANYEEREKAPLSLHKDYVFTYMPDINPEMCSLIYVSGDSMTKWDHPGNMPDKTMILFDRSQKQVVSGKYYVVRIGEDLLVKQVFKDVYAVKLHSLNPDYQVTDKLLSTAEDWQDIEILGRVVYKQYGRAL